ncbi:MAG TPA: nuclear transport factor 2 family protein [Pseudonocardia sp.]|jgi:predicted ester cyclase|nr:nuclear transport factor 2 family protein [Pseudonocardia sp.]
MGVPTAEAGVLDRDFAERWYREGWIRAWNENRPEMCADLVTDDFVLDSPTTRHTKSLVQGPAAAAEYIRYVLGAYPDLQWEITEAPMYSDVLARAAFSWRGTGHFTGRLDPPGIPGTGNAFEFSGLEVFDFRDGKACYLNATYDLLGLMKQIGLYRRASSPA